MKIRALADYSQPLVAAATLIGIAIVISAGFGAYSAYRIKTSANVIEVTGSAKQAVDSDFARWTINLTSKTPVDDQQVGFDTLAAATSKIVSYLKSQGFEDVEVTSPNVNPDYFYPERAAPVLTGYTVNRQVIVRSSDIEKVSALSGNIKPLSGTNYEVTTGFLELTYQGLPDLRVELLSGAIKDARSRAEAIAKETGRKVGSLKSATGGVVQVLPQGGIDVSDYGSYDIQSKKKDIMVTVRATFILR